MSKVKENLSVFLTILFKGAYIHNCLLTTLTGLCTVTAGVTGIKNALTFSLAFFICVTVCEISANALLRNVTRYVRVAVCSVISFVCVLAVAYLILPESVTPMGMYLPLLCVNGIIVFRCEKFAVRAPFLYSVYDAAASSLGFFAVAVIVGGVRSLLAGGLIPGFGGAGAPYIALAVIGVLAFFHRLSVKTFFPNEITDTFSLRSVFEKMQIKDPGLHGGRVKETPGDADTETEESGAIRPRYEMSPAGAGTDDEGGGEE